MKKQINSFKVAFQGIWYVIKTESHMRFHIVAACYVVLFGILFGVSFVEWAALSLAIVMVMSCEIINTSIERLSDLDEKENNRTIKIVKDAAAGAVLISAVGSAFVGLFIFMKPEKIAWVFGYFLSNPIALIILGISIILAILFIVKGSFNSKR